MDLASSSHQPDSSPASPKIPLRAGVDEPVVDRAGRESPGALSSERLEESGHLRTLYMSPAAQLSGYSHFTMPYYFDHSGAHSNARVGSSARRRHKARTGSGSGTGAASGTGHRTTAANAAGHNAADADEEGLLLRQRPHSSRGAADSERCQFLMGGEALLPNQMRRDGGRDESAELELEAAVGGAVGGAAGGTSDVEPQPIGREVIEAHELFCEMLELVTEERVATTESPDARGAPLPPPLQCWSECARWIKFEEDVEEEGERWSKPHVAALSLHSLLSLRSCLSHACLLLNADAPSLDTLVDLVLDRWVGQRRLSTERRDVLRATLLLRAVHLHERQRLGGLHGLSVSQRSSSVLPPLSIIRSLADIGRKYSAREVDRDNPNNSQASLSWRTGGLLSADQNFDGSSRKPSACSVGPPSAPSASAGVETGALLKRLPEEQFGSGSVCLSISGLAEESLVSSSTAAPNSPPERCSPPSVRTPAASLEATPPVEIARSHHSEPEFAPTHPHSFMKQASAPATATAPVVLTALVEQQQQHDVATETSSTQSPRYDSHFMKKVPANAEAAHVLVGELEELAAPLVALVRLEHAVLLGNLSEVPVPSRFLFVLLGPVQFASKNHEIGRSMATLMSDEVFRDVAYRARRREDILFGVDEFLANVTCLPPGEWDPAIRIEPPAVVPSQEARKTGVGLVVQNGVFSAAEPKRKLTPHRRKCDPTLVRTGRLFGGMLADVRRKARWYVSDVSDACSLQCVASFVFLYFALLAPLITFGGLLETKTRRQMGAFESILAATICGIVYALFAGQPLTLLSTTGPVMVFEEIMLDFTDDYKLNFLSFRLWIGLWSALILLVLVAFDLSAYVRYITRFTEESFAALVSFIFIWEAFKMAFTKPEQPERVALESYSPLRAPNASAAAPAVFYDNYTGELAASVALVNRTERIFTECRCSPIRSVLVSSLEPENENVTYSYVERTRFWELARNRSNWKVPLEPEEVALYNCSTAALVECEVKPRLDWFYFGFILFAGTFALSAQLKRFRSTRFLPITVRCLASDFSVALAIVIMSAFDALVGVDTPKLNVPHEFRPTSPTRGWLVPPLAGNPWWTVPLAFPPALLCCILLFMDQQITSVIVNRREHKLAKGCGYHLDLFVIALLVLVCSVLGLPLFVAATVQSLNHVKSLQKMSTCNAPGEMPKNYGCREQRMTALAIHICIGLSMFFTPLLKYIPIAVLYGVFLYMGVSSLGGVQFIERCGIVFMPSKYQPDHLFLRHVPLRRVHLFTLIQTLCVVAMWGLKLIKPISFTFPLCVMAMCFVRKAMERFFSTNELGWIDELIPEPAAIGAAPAAAAADGDRRSCGTGSANAADEENASGTTSAAASSRNSVIGGFGFGSAARFPPAAGAAEQDDIYSLNMGDVVAKTSIWKQLLGTHSFDIRRSNSERVSPKSAPEKAKAEKTEPVSSKVTSFVGRLKHRRKTIEVGTAAATLAQVEMTPVLMLTEPLKEEQREPETEAKRSKPNEQTQKTPRPPEIVVTGAERARVSLNKSEPPTAAEASTVAGASASAPSQRKFFPSASASASAAFSFLRGERHRANSQSDVCSGPSSTASSDGEGGGGREREKERERLYKKRGGSFKGPPARHPRAFRQASGGSSAWVMRPPAIVIDPPSDGESHTLFADIERIDGTH